LPFEHFDAVDVAFDCPVKPRWFAEVLTTTLTGDIPTDLRLSSTISRYRLMGLEEQGRQQRALAGSGKSHLVTCVRDRRHRSQQSEAHGATRPKRHADATPWAESDAKR
jgi:hypothetical protein